MLDRSPECALRRTDESCAIADHHSFEKAIAWAANVEPRFNKRSALFSPRLGVESGRSRTPDSSAAATMMPDSTIAESSRAQSVRELRELIAALDRRVPRVERVGEIAIAQAAAVLKSEALKRIQELERESPPGPSTFL
jgi:hypothetical protein